MNEAAQARQARPDPGCPHCNGTGEVFEHAYDCDDDLCALNGDVHSCAGQVEACGCANPNDPHGRYWARIALAAEAVAASPNCTQEDAARLCAALDRLSSALMGEAQEDMTRLSFLEQASAAVEHRDAGPDGMLVRIVLATTGDAPAPATDWHTSLRSAIDQATRSIGNWPDGVSSKRAEVSRD